MLLIFVQFLWIVSDYMLYLFTKVILNICVIKEEISSLILPLPRSQSYKQISVLPREIRSKIETWLSVSVWDIHSMSRMGRTRIFHVDFSQLIRTQFSDSFLASIYERRDLLVWSCIKRIKLYDSIICLYKKVMLLE